MGVNWDEIDKCRLWKILGVSECDDCPDCRKCWGDEVEFPNKLEGSRADTSCPPSLPTHTNPIARVIQYHSQSAPNSAT